MRILKIIHPETQQLIATHEFESSLSFEEEERIKKLYIKSSDESTPTFDDILIKQNLSDNILYSIYNDINNYNFSIEVLDLVFKEYQDVFDSIKSGFYLLAIYRLSLKEPNEYITQVTIDNWKNLIKSHL